MAFVPLHVHTEYSLLDGMSTIEELANAASKCGFPGIAITDHGTMMGAKEFHWRMRKQGIKPIIGDEIYLTDYDHKLKDDEHKHYNHLILLAKNEVGYHNLCKIASIGATEGFYRKKARVNHDVVKQYSEGLICLSACIGGEIPQCILEGDVEGAKESIKWYKEVFGEDFYLEVCIHPSTAYRLLKVRQGRERCLFLPDTTSLLSRKNRINMIKRLLLSLLLLLPLGLTSYAQRDTLWLSSSFTTHVIFPSDLSYVDLSDTYLLAAMIVDQSKNVLAIKACQPFKGATSVTAIESNREIHILMAG